ncbi:MAG: transcriptional regulator [Archaeoglobus sp.]|jgi:Fic family protein|nr:MAG: transcriptional regulator [Archaeoglobus sp.]
MNECEIEILRSIKDALLRIEKRLENIESNIQKNDKMKEISDPFKLLELPDNLRITAMAMIKIGEGTAEDVSKITGRSRPMESHYLSSLVRLGFLKKKRVGRKVVYYR